MQYVRYEPNAQEELIPEIENEPLQTREMFSTNNDPEDVLDDEKS